MLTWRILYDAILLEEQRDRDVPRGRRAAAGSGALSAIVRALSADEAFACGEKLAEVLLDCIAGGASVSFMQDFSRAQAVEYWAGVAAAVRAGRRVLLVAGDVDGTAQLLLDTPPNQPHRAELAKMLVHRRARRGGLGRALFQGAEAEALRRGRTLLTFDTLAGTAAERLYLACGCTKVGEIPGYALLPDGGVPAATSVFFKSCADARQEFVADLLRRRRGAPEQRHEVRRARAVADLLPDRPLQRVRLAHVAEVLEHDAPLKAIASGFAFPWPAMSGALPCTGSNSETRPGWMLPQAAIPSPPVSAAPRSVRMSPKRLLVTITSNASGWRTRSIAIAST